MRIDEFVVILASIVGTAMPAGTRESLEMSIELFPDRLMLLTMVVVLQPEERSAASSRDPKTT